MRKFHEMQIFGIPHDGSIFAAFRCVGKFEKVRRETSAKFQLGEATSQESRHPSTIDKGREGGIATGGNMSR